LLLVLLCGCAKEEAPALTAEPTPLPVPSVKLPPLPSPAAKPEYQEAKLYFDGLLADRCYVKNDVLYISPDSIAGFYAMELETEISESGFSISSLTLEMKGSSAKHYMTANHRYLYTPEGFLTVGESVYLPVHVIEKVFALNVTVYGEPLCAEIKSDEPSIIQGGENYYDLNFDSGDYYWLQQIIYSESRDEPLAGMIGVGNVVYNRVQSELYPDTVFEVIFDRKYAVQFDPISTGGIREGADEKSRIAACLCLEGYSTVGDSLFFVNPGKGDPTWVSSNRTFVCTIGNHDFYA